MKALSKIRVPVCNHNCSAQHFPTVAVMIMYYCSTKTGSSPKRFLHRHSSDKRKRRVLYNQKA